MSDYFAWNIANPSAPGSDIVPITPDDNNDIRTELANGNVAVGVRALRATSAGTMRVLMANGQTRDLDFVAGETRVGQFLRVLSTGTTVNSDSSGEGIEGHV